MLNIISRTGVVITIISLGLALSTCGYNTIPTLEEQAKARWSDVQNQYQRRTDLIPNLVATVLRGIALAGDNGRGCSGNSGPCAQR